LFGAKAVPSILKNFFHNADGFEIKWDGFFDRHELPSPLAFHTGALIVEGDNISAVKWKLPDILSSG
jgi:hypothetical protein